MSDAVGAVAGDRLLSFVERVFHIDDEIKSLNEGKKEILEQFPIRRNRRGFSNRQRSDSSCVLAKEAGMHGPGAFP